MKSKKHATTQEPKSNRKPGPGRTPKTAKDSQANVLNFFRSLGLEDERDHLEISERVCRDFINGVAPESIKEWLREEQKREPPREIVWDFVRYAGAQGWLQLRIKPELGNPLADELKRGYPAKSLDYLEVVPQPSPEYLGERAAERLLELIKLFAVRMGQRDIHIGFGGGRTMNTVARAFAKVLETSKWPDNVEAITIHALVAGYTQQAYATDPHSFLTYFYFKDEKLREKIRYVRLPVPSICEEGVFTALKQRSDQVRDVYEKDAKKLHIAVTSAGVWRDSHSTLRRYARSQGPAYERSLDEQDIVGDLLWQPLAADPEKPVSLPRGEVPTTTLKLADMPEFISGEWTEHKKPGRVLLVLGTCAAVGCGSPKGAMLRTILGQPKELITDLIVDAPTCRQTLEDSPVETTGLVTVTQPQRAGSQPSGRTSR